MSSILTCPRVPITDVLAFIVDNRGKTVPTSASGFPLIATNCVSNHRLYPVFDKIRYVDEETYNTWFRAHLQPNDILFVNKGTPGRCCLVPDPVTFCAAQDMIGLRCDPTKIYYRYLLMVLRSQATQQFIANYHVGIAIPHFKKEDLSKLMISLPDMKEQIKMGDLYFKICKAEENNNTISATLESLAKTIYDYWFVQFDFPDENGRPYKSSGGKMVWNEELKREIPEGWEVKTYRDVLEIGNGKDHKALSDGLMPVYGSGGLMRLVDSSLYSGESVLIPRKGTLNNIMYVDETFWTVDTMYYTKMKKEHIAKYMFYVTKSYDFERLNTGTGVPSMTSDIIYKLRALMPDNDILRMFDEKMTPFYKTIQHAKKENQKLASLRDFLLPMLMNGQVKIEDKA